MKSYGLLFQADRKSRKLYKSKERLRARLNADGDEPYIDPFLDNLCGHHISTSRTFTGPVRDAYDAEVDFPILRERLEKILQHMQGIQPNRFMALWRDQRDLRLWYTIWAVIILGILGIVIALASMLLAAIQVNYARMAYELQLSQGA